MQKAGALIFLLLVGLPILLAAQGEKDDPSDGSEWDYYYDENFSRGDQTFIITLGTIFPIVFVNNEGIMENKISPRVGGTGSLAYNYYINTNIFLGGEVSGMFFSTLGDNNLFIIPLGVRAGYQFNMWRLEFPLSIAIGMVWHRYNNEGYYGLYMKGGGSAFFRATSRWSFGLNTNWYWFPQWTGDSSKNAHGNMLDLTLSARYHF